MRRSLFQSLLLGTVAIGTVTSGCFAHAEPSVAVAHRDQATSQEILTTLDPYGSWLNVSPYGRVWRPNGLGVAWQPYSRGYWVSSRDTWLWHSDFNWGWAAFHYGRWHYDTTYGWVWVPGYQYAPAWVVWRTNGAWISWAPTPIGMSIYDPLFISRIPNRNWCYVSRGDFGRPRVSARPAPPKDFFRTSRIQSRPAIAASKRNRSDPQARPARRARPAPIRVSVPPRRGFSASGGTASARPKTSTPPRGRPARASSQGTPARSTPSQRATPARKTSSQRATPARKTSTQRATPARAQKEQSYKARPRSTAKVKPSRPAPKMRRSRSRPPRPAPKARRAPSRRSSPRGRAVRK